MKKNWFLLFVLLCSVSIFTGCSDDEDNSWKNIPDTEISGENADLTVNGAASTGSVKLTVQNPELAILDLKNVINGYPDVSMDVTLTKQTDTTFIFVGSKDLTTAPTKATEKLPALLKIDVKGSVTVSGKIKIDITTSGVALSVGTYSGNNLKLTYSDRELPSKTITLSVAEGSASAFLSLPNIIPGEPEAIISDVQLNENNEFNGQGQTAGGCIVKYAGSVKDEVMTLSLNVTLSNELLGNLNGTWNMPDTVVYTDEGRVSYAPILFNWKASAPVMEDGKLSSDQITDLLRLVASPILANVLHTVTFHSDGNITAEYFPNLKFDEKLIGDMLNGMIDIPEDRKWEVSPVNLAFWYTKNDTLFVIPNLEMILNQISLNNGTDLSQLATIIKNILPTVQNLSEEELQEMIKSMLEKYELPIDINQIKIKNILNWLITGVPVKYKIGNGLQAYVDKEMVAPFMSLLLPILPSVQEKLDSTMIELSPGHPQSIGDLLRLMGPFMLGIGEVTQIEDMWKDTSVFELGLELKK